MFIPKRLWRLVEAAGTAVWLVSLAAGIAVTVAAAFYGAFENLPRLVQVVAVILVFALASIVILEVVQYGRLQAGRFRGPQLRISAGSGFEFVHQTRPLKRYSGERALDELIEWDFPDDEFKVFYTLKLKVAETASARAKNIVVRITGINPPPEPGEYSLPIRLSNVTSHSDDNTLEPGEVGYVALLHVTQTAEGRTGLAPAFWFLHDECIFGVEALVDGKSSDMRYFRMTGLVAHTPEGKRVVAGIPDLEEVESLNPEG